MNRDVIIKKSLMKLATLQKREMDDLVKDLEKIYLKNKKTPYADTSFSKDIVRHMQYFVKEVDFDQKEKLYLFNELKKKNMFNWDLNKHLEKAWRFIFRKWDLPSLNFN
jgi:hypothetical protein